VLVVSARLGGYGAAPWQRPTHRYKRQLQRFKLPQQAQGFHSPRAFIHGHFRPDRARLTAIVFHPIRTERVAIWQQETWTRPVA
jgi:hypothetical protein